MPATIIDNLKTMLGTVAQIERVYDDPPESLSEFPSAMVYTTGGEVGGMGSGNMREFHDLVIDIYSHRNVLPQAIDEAKIWPGIMFPKLIGDPTLTGAASAIDGEIQYISGPMEYGRDNTYYGVRFTLRYKKITTY